MKTENYMEFVVDEALDWLWASKDDICKCERCRLDIMTWALNNLPPKYIVSKHGRIHTKIEETKIQFQADIVRELLKAIKVVAAKPHHLD